MTILQAQSLPLFSFQSRQPDFTSVWTHLLLGNTVLPGLASVTRIDLCNPSLPRSPYFWILIFIPCLLVDPARRQKIDGVLYWAIVFSPRNSSLLVLRIAILFISSWELGRLLARGRRLPCNPKSSTRSHHIGGRYIFQLLTHGPTMRSRLEVSYEDGDWAYAYFHTNVVESGARSDDAYLYYLHLKYW